MIQIYLKQGKEVAIKRQHPWIFSGAIDRIEGNAQDGDLAEVFDKKGNYLATGHYHNGSIAIKIISFERCEIDVAFWQTKLQNALDVRQEILKANPAKTTAFRLVHGEGDGFSGLILDYYDGVVVFQAHTIGMWRVKNEIVTALKNLDFGIEKAIIVYDKSKETLPKNFAENIKNDYHSTDAGKRPLDTTETAGKRPTIPHPIFENNQQFLIDWETGQKTGFFLDQRDNRALLGQYAKGKKVLNAFCYSGGFSVYALANGAAFVHSVDVSKKAVDLVNQNVEVNFGENAPHQAFAQDVMAYLKENDQVYDLIVLDPPAFAKNLSAKHNAVQGYKRLNAAGLKSLSKGGLLFTFSCSQVIDRQLFYDTVVAAALEVGRQVRVLHHLTQAPDHPVNFFHPEGQYLKGLVLRVE